MALRKYMDEILTAQYLKTIARALKPSDYIVSEK